MMSAIAALSWKEWRQVRLETLGLLVPCMLAPAAILAIGSRHEPEAGLPVATLVFVVASAGLVLGSTLVSGDGALPWLRSRAVPPLLLVACRVGVRLLALAGIALLALASFALAEAAFPSGAGQVLLDRDNAASFGAVVLAAFAASAAASSFTARPVGAVVSGVAVLWLVLGACVGLHVLRDRPHDARGGVLIAGALVLMAAAASLALQRVQGTWPDASRATRALGKFVAMGAAVLLAIYGGVGELLARHQAEQAREAWRRIGRPLEDIPARFPAVATNGTARELEQLAESMDIQLVPWSERARNSRQRRDHAVLARGLDGWLDAALGHGAGAADESPVVAMPPPAAVVAYMATHEQALAGIRQVLASGEPPTWTVDLAQGAEAPIPNLLGHVALGKVLVADALLATQQDDHARADADLVAAWTLGTSLQRRPDLVSQLVASSLLRKPAVALRWMVEPSPEWEERLRSDAGGPLLSSVAAEAWVLLDGGVLRGIPLHVRLARPWIAFRVARGAELLADTVESAGRCGTIDVAYYDAGDDVYVITPAGLWSIWTDRVAGLEVDLDLTRLVLALRQARAESGAWPPELPALPDPHCPQLRWAYAVEPDGSASVQAVEPPPQPASPREWPRSHVLEPWPPPS